MFATHRLRSLPQLRQLTEFITITYTEITKCCYSERVITSEKTTAIIPRRFSRVGVSFKIAKPIKRHISQFTCNKWWWSRNLVTNFAPSTLNCRNQLRSWNDNVGALILSRDLGLHRCYSASCIVPSTLPATGFFRLQADEAELFTASAFHVLTGPHMLNQHAARYACAEGGATHHSNNFLPGAITKDPQTSVLTGTVSIPWKEK